jgi:hypothetical protein
MDGPTCTRCWNENYRLLTFSNVRFAEPPKPALPLFASATSFLSDRGGRGTIQFKDWCLSIDEPIGNHFRQVMIGQAASLDTGIQATAAILPLIEGKLPTTKNIRSGDLGEIYATHVAVVTARRSNVCVAAAVEMP